MGVLLQYVGIDAGGTLTRLLARTVDGRADLVLRGDGTNLLRHGEEHAARLMASLLRQVLVARSDLPLGAVVAGVAGAGEPEAQQPLAKRIRELLGGAAPKIIEVIHDGVIALETAFPASSGMLMIAGTGSAVLARTKRGTIARVGGWGYLLGDEGSGYAIGRRGMAAVAHAADGGPTTTLAARLAERHDIIGRRALLFAAYTDLWPLQHMAPIVLEASEEGDAVAQKIVATEVMALTQQARWLQQLEPDICPRICLSGGLSRSAYYYAAISQALQTILPEFQLGRQTKPSIRGAVSLAQQLAEGTVMPAALRVTGSAGCQ